MDFPAFLMGVGGSLSALLFLGGAAGGRGLWLRAAKLEEAQPVDLRDEVPAAQSPALATPEPVVHDGAWVAVTGTVQAREPVLSMNKTPAAVLVESLYASEVYANYRGGLAAQQRVLHRSWGEASSGWSLSGRRGVPVVSDDLAPPSRVYEAEVARDAVRQAAQREPISVSGLTPAGMNLETPLRSVGASLLMLLTGTLREEYTRVHEIVAIGHPFTVVALASVVDGKLSLRTHPLLGFALSRDLRATVSRYRGSSVAMTLLSAVFGAASVYLLRSAVARYWENVALRSAIRDALSNGRTDGGSGPEQPAVARAVEVRLPSISPTALLRGLTHVLFFPISLLFVGLPAAAQTEARVVTRTRADVVSTAAALSAPDVPPTSREDECVACTERRRVVVLSPCGHLCLCATCARTVMAMLEGDRKCPMCRRSIVSCLRVYGLADSGSTAAQPQVATLSAAGE